MLTILAVTSLALHALWWSGNLYEALVFVPAWLTSWRQGRAPGVRIDPRVYYIPAYPAPVVAAVAAGVAYAQSLSTRPWLAAAAAASLAAAGLTVYVVATINLELFFGDPPPAAARGLVLMQRWAALNLIRVAVVAVVLGTTARACWELVRLHGLR